MITDASTLRDICADSISRCAPIIPIWQRFRGSSLQERFPLFHADTQSACVSQRADSVIEFRTLRQLWLESTLWSALTSQRFDRSRPVATMVRLNSGKDFGVKPPKAKAVTGHRTPKSCGAESVDRCSELCLRVVESREQELAPEVESTISTINDETLPSVTRKVMTSVRAVRQNATLEESTATFKTLRTKLGPEENRTLQSATEQQNSGAH